MFTKKGQLIKAMVMNNVGNVSGCIVVLFFTVLLAACSTDEIDVLPVFDSPYCGSVATSIVEIEDSAALRKAIRGKSQINLLADNKQSDRETMDFDLWRVFVVSAGEQPSAGYSLSLRSNKAVYDKKAEAFSVPIALTTPAPDSLQAQVLTQPCIIVKARAKDLNGEGLTLESNLNL